MTYRYKILRGVLVSALVFGLLGLAHAGVIIYSGNDANVAPGGAHPNSNAAASAFDAAAGFHSLITFEGLPIGNFGSLLIAPGVTVTLTGTAGDANAGITNAQDQTLGFNITTGGSEYLRVVPQFGGPDVFVDFAFATPISAFGAYLTGTETSIDGTISINFTDGTVQVISIVKNDVPGVQFVGFTDLGKSISSVTFIEAGPFGSRDIWGIDDVRYTPIPEPGTLALLGSGIVGLASVLRRKLNF